MSTLVNVSRSLSYYVCREDNQQELRALWRYILKNCWCLEQANTKDLLGVCLFSWISNLINTLSKSMPSSTNRLAHILHLLSEENLSMYRREDFLRILFYAVAPIFIVYILTKLENLRDSRIRRGRPRPRLFVSMGDRLLDWYLVYKFVQIPFCLLRILVSKPASEWLFSALDFWIESIITDGSFLLWMFFVCIVADCWLGV